MTGISHDQLTETLKQLGGQRAKLREALEHFQKNAVQAQQQLIATEAQFAMITKLIQDSIKSSPEAGTEEKVTANGKQDA